MAVVMTTKFYEEYTPAWHDLSKIVFTSPNIDSPNTAGTRSHILPGKGNLALWYEDSANMYEMEPLQNTYDTSFYYYHVDVASGINLDSNPTSALITLGNFPSLYSYVNKELDIPVIGYTLLNQNIVNEELCVSYLGRIVNDYDLENIYSNSITHTTEFFWWNSMYLPRLHTAIQNCWKVNVIEEILPCYIEFEFNVPTNVRYIEMSPQINTTTQYTYYQNPGESMGTIVTTNVDQYYIGNFKIQGKSIDGQWVDLYVGNNSTAALKEIFMLENVEYYMYYRLFIVNNASLAWTSHHYAVSKLAFYGYEYSSLPGTGYIVLSEFGFDNSCRELHVDNITTVTGDPVNTIHNTISGVDGVINIATYIGVGETEEATYYNIDVNEIGDSTNYHSTAIGKSVTPTISGTTGEDGTTGTTTVNSDTEILTDGYINITGETKIENGYIYANLTGQELDISYSNSEYNIITNITYTTVLSGIVIDGFIGNVEVIGCTNRYESRYSSERGITHEISLINTVGSGIIANGSSLYLWEQPSFLEGVEFTTYDSIVFEITQGEAYDCRLTAWDDVTHSTTINHLIAGDYVRVSALAFRAEGTVLTPESSTTINNYIASPVYNRIFKGNVVYEGTNYYYGDFDLSHRTEPGMIGDYLIFKPMLYEIDDTIPYGIHDHVIVLHYTYT